MKENGGSIVNILMELHGGWAGFAHSVSARAGVEALSKTLAVEWGKFLFSYALVQIIKLCCFISKNKL